MKRMHAYVHNGSVTVSAHDYMLRAKSVQGTSWDVVTITCSVRKEWLVGKLATRTRDAVDVQAQGDCMHMHKHTHRASHPQNKGSDVA